MKNVIIYFVFTFLNKETIVALKPNNVKSRAIMSSSHPIFELGQISVHSVLHGDQTIPLFWKDFKQRPLRLVKQKKIKFVINLPNDLIHRKLRNSLDFNLRFVFRSTDYI